jgi:Flp pilus assembly protein TadG
LKAPTAAKEQEPEMFSLREFASRMVAGAGGFKAKRDGMAAIEFAMIVPVMALLLIGIVELSYAMTVYLRVQQAANSSADLVARAENQISQSELSDIMAAGSYIFAPFDTGPETITLRQVMSSPSDASNTKQDWQCTYTGSTQSLVCTCTDTAYTLPANVISNNDSIIVGQASYDYTPLVFNHFLMTGLSGLSDGAGGYLLSSAGYLRPRGTTPMLLQPNGNPCPPPTFGG